MDHYKTKTALITGGTSGVGLSIVRSLLQQHYHVFFVGASTTKGKELERAFGGLYPGMATYVNLDLSDLKAVDRFAREFASTHHHLDILAHIAGVVLPQRTVTAEGLEKTFAIGYMSPFILSQNLGALLGKTKGSRIVNVAASAKSILPVKLDFQDLQSTQKYNGFKVSLATVHAKTVLTEILAQRLGSFGITVNAFHPGMVRSELTRNMPFLFRIMGKAISPFMAKASTNGIFVCTSAKLKDVSGQLFENQSPIALAFDQKYKDTLWTKTQEILTNLNIKLDENSQL